MDVREKLVELVDKARRYAANKCHSFMSCAECGHCGEYDGNCRNTYIAESLIADGVTVQEFDGCEYCKEDSEGFRRMFGAFSLVNPFHGKTWQIHAGKCKPREINFCPMCGRRLPQPPKGE